MIGTEDARSGALWFVAPMVRAFYGRLPYTKKKTLNKGDDTLNRHTSERLGNKSLRIRVIHQSVEMMI